MRHPVTDTLGRCVGVLSVADILRWAADGGRADVGGGSEASCVWSDWQVVGVQSAPHDEVRRHMTGDPLLVTPDTRLAEIARVLLDPGGRPVVVVDARRRPLGVVSSQDVLAALAPAERRPEAEPPAGAATDGRSPLRRSVQAPGRA